VKPACCLLFGPALAAAAPVVTITPPVDTRAASQIDRIGLTDRTDPTQDAAAAPAVPEAPITDTCVPWDGYRGIWFSIGQDVPVYGAKYSGGLATYTAKHRPTAIYAAAVERTFFTYGGIDDESGDLQIMVSLYDHRTNTVPRPTRLLRWHRWTDPHCNASLAIDPGGHVWVFISGRARARAGYKYRSKRPYDVTDFARMRVEEMAYPQPCYVAGQGFLHLFTKYTAGRELYWETSDPSGETWSEDHKLAGFGGHYQITAERDGKVVTAFNYHPHGVDTRTNLYFAQTTDFGQTWTTADGKTLTLPLASRDNAALICDWEAQGLLCYLKDITFDPAGNPLILFETSRDFRAGPSGDPRLYRLARWTGREWVVTEVCPTDHDYDMGSLYVEPEVWRVLAPTGPGAKPYHTGGEVVSWISRDQGATWAKERDVTGGSALHQSYVRRPLGAHDPFYAFWAEADSHDRGPSGLLFCNHDGSRVWRLPRTMAGAVATPEPVD
jgi:hypothetical protein